MGQIFSAAGAVLKVLGTVVQVASLAYSIYRAATMRGPDVEGPRLGDTRQPTSTYGKPIPFGYGRMRVASNLIWSADIEEVKTVKEMGGKGSMFGGPTYDQTTYSYYGSMALLFGEGPGVIRRLFADGKVIYDVRTPYKSNSKYPTAAIRTYEGTETQLPDPLMEAVEGAGNVPGYRGMVYAVIEDLPLLDFGNRIPMLEAEIAYGSSTIPVHAAMTNGQDLAYLDAAMMPTTNQLYFIANNKIGRLDRASNEVEAITAADPFSSEITGGLRPLQVHPGRDNRLFVLGSRLSDGLKFFVELNPITLDLLGAGSSTAAFAAKGINQTFSANAADGASITFAWQGPVTGAFRNLTLLYALGSDGGPDNGSKLVLYDRDQPSGPLVGGALEMDSYVFPISGANPINLFSACVDREGSVYLLGYDPDEAEPAGKLWRVDFHETQTLAPLLEIPFFLWNLPFQVPQVGVPGVAMDVKEIVDLGVDFNVHHPKRIAWDWGTDTLVILGSVDSNDEATWIRWDPVTRTAVETKVWDATDADEEDIIGDSGDWQKIVRSYQQGTFRGELLMPNSDQSQWYMCRVLDFEAREIAGDSIVTGGFGFSGAYHDYGSNSVYAFPDNSGGDDITRIYYEANDVGAVTLTSVIDDLMDRAGMAGADYDVDSAMGSDLVKGYTVGRQAPLRGILDPLAFQYLFDVIESEWKLVFVKKGQASVRTITEDDMGASPGGVEGNPFVLEEKREKEADLPQRLAVVYMEEARDFQEGTQHVSRPGLPVFETTTSRDMTTAHVPLLMTAGEARTGGQRQMYDAWIKRTSYKGALLPKHLDLDPADVITLSMDDGRSLVVKIQSQQLDEGYLTKLEMVPEEPVIYQSTAVGAEVAVRGTSISPPGATELFLLDLPLLRDEDNPTEYKSGLYVAYGAYLEEWRGAWTERSEDGSDWVSFDAARDAAPWGYLTTAMAAIPMKPDNTFDMRIEGWDDATTMTVRIVQGIDELASKTDEQVLGGQNVMVIGERTRQGSLYGPMQEICQFANVSVDETDGEGGGLVTLTRLNRGRRGSEYEAVEGHLVGARVIFIDAENTTRKTVPLTDAATDRFYRAASSGAVIQSSLTERFALLANDLRTYAPINVEATVPPGSSRDPVVLTWTRRSRIGGNDDFLDGVTDVPLGEDSEEYLAVLLNPAGDTEMDEETVYAETASFSEARQGAAGYDPGDVLKVVIYQISELTDRGYGAQATL